jgi:hypothetical protein
MRWTVARLSTTFGVVRGRGRPKLAALRVGMVMT